MQGTGEQTTGDMEVWCSYFTALVVDERVTRSEGAYSRLTQHGRTAVVKAAAALLPPHLLSPQSGP